MFVGAAVRISDPSGIIYQAIWLYLRFTLSFRDIEDLLAQRGIAVSYETVPRWVNCYTPDKNLAHSGSSESLDNNAPSKAGAKHLARKA
jgi:transposase-like protein